MTLKDMKAAASEAADVVRLLELIWEILGPVASRMFQQALQHNDPVDVLLKENVVDILPTSSRTEIAMIQARRKAASQ